MLDSNRHQLTVAAVSIRPIKKIADLQSCSQERILSSRLTSRTALVSRIVSLQLLHSQLGVFCWPQTDTNWPLVGTVFPELKDCKFAIQLAWPNFELTTCEDKPNDAGFSCLFKQLATSVTCSIIYFWVRLKLHNKFYECIVVKTSRKIVLVCCEPPTNSSFGTSRTRIALSHRIWRCLLFRNWHHSWVHI